MQAIMETLFDALYLTSVITIGIIMILKGGNNKQFKLFGIMAVVLGVGDSFHLIPRAYALLTTGLENNVAALGIGKFITSITMTIFYVILYYIWRQRYNIKGRKEITFTIYALAIVRIILCFLPQNEWLNHNSPVSWGIYRNIPFAIIGIIIIYIFNSEVKKHGDKNFKFMALAIILSFALYVPVVLWSNVFPLVGVLMIPKTLAYVWIVLMGYKELRLEYKNKVI
jgi:hypothetical protein